MGAQVAKAVDALYTPDELAELLRPQPLPVPLISKYEPGFFHDLFRDVTAGAPMQMLDRLIVSCALLGSASRAPLLLWLLRLARAPLVVVGTRGEH